MPIIVQHTPVGALSQLAVKAGEAQAQQAKMARDLQLTQLAISAQQRNADRAEQRRGQREAFAMQRALAKQVAPVQQPPRLTERGPDISTTLKQAAESGLYSPEQLTQMKIFAGLGDTQSIRRILGNTQVETEQQLGELKQMADAGIIDPDTYQINRLRILGGYAPQISQAQEMPVSVRLLPFRQKLEQLQKDREFASQWRSNFKPGSEDYQRYDADIRRLDAEIQSVVKEAQQSFTTTQPTEVGKVVTPEIIFQLRQKFGTDKQAARQWLIEHGYKVD